jgi:hypothetical protein
MKIIVKNILDLTEDDLNTTFYKNKDTLYKGLSIIENKNIEEIKK